MVETATRYDPFDAGFREDPYPTWQELREHEPLHRSAFGIYVLTRYEDVWALLRDHRTSREIPIELVYLSAGSGATAESFMGNLLNKEAPDHTRLRKLLATAFTPRLVRDLRQRVVALVDEVLDDAEAHGGRQIDLAAEIGAVLPVLVVGSVLGLPAEDAYMVRPWAAAMANASTIMPTPEDRVASDDAVVAYRSYFEQCLSGQRRLVPDGLLAVMARAEAAHIISHEELIANATLLYFAGFETTTNLIGNGMLALLRHPDQMTRLWGQPELVPTAVEEMLRYDSPVQTSVRWTSEPVDVIGGTIKARRVIEISLAAANHDPRVFADPERLDIGRSNNPHVAFGTGRHFCLGARLARLEGEVLLGRMVDRYSAIEQAGPIVRKPSVGLRGLESLPVRVTRRP